MALDKLVDSSRLDGALGSTADAIRSKTGDEGLLTWDMDEGFSTAIGDIVTLDEGTADADATSGDILNGKTAYVQGLKVTGNIPTKTSADMSVSGKTVTVPKGYYASQQTKSVDEGSVTLATPTVNASGLVTSNATVTAGYVSSNPTNKTLQLSTQAGKTVTPTESEQTAVASGKYTTGAVKVGAVSSTYVGSEVPRNDSEDLTVSGRTVTAPIGYYDESASASIGVGAVSSGTATISSVSHLYNSSTGKFDVSGSGDISAPTVDTAGYISSAEGTKSGVTGGAAVSATENKIVGSTAITGASTRKPSIAKQDTPSGVTNAANGDATTTAPSSGVYVAVKSSANTGTLTATPSVTSEGYGTTANHGITGNTATVGALASDTTYVPVKTTTASVSGKTVSYGSGWITEGSKSVADGSVTQNAPTINTSTGLVTATSTVTEGYVGADTKSNTLQLSTQGAQTITPGTTDKTIASGKYLTGTQTIKGDADLTAANIKKGVDIFGVTGTFTTTPSGKTALTAAALRTGYAGFINGSQVNGSMADTTVTEGTTTISSGTVTRGTWSQTAGYTDARTVDAATFASEGTSGTKYVDISAYEDAPILVSGDYLYINKGYTDNLKISLAKLVPNGSDVKGHGEYILSGHSAYDNEGALVSGTIPTKTALTVNGKTVTAPSGYYASDTSASVAVGTVTSGTASITSLTKTYNSTSGKFDITGSADVSAPSVGTAGYISTTEGTRSKKTGGATVSATIDKIVGSTAITGTTTKQPSITKQATPSGVTNAASGNATTTAPSSGVYVAVQSAANTGTLTATPSVTTAGYGDATNHGITGNTATVGASASAMTYVPITTTSASLSGRTVSYGSGWITEGSKSVGVGTVTSGTASITSLTKTYNSSTGKFDITGSADVSAPSVGTAGYISSSEGTRNKNTGGASVSTTINKIVGSTAITGTTTAKPSITKQDVPSGVTQAASGNATTTAPTSGVYVAVKSAANTGTLTATPSVTTEGYGTSSYHGIAGNTATVGASASDTTYVPITTTTASVSGKTVTYGTGWITGGSKSVADGAYSASVSAHSISTTPVVTGALSGGGASIGSTTKPSGTDGTDYWAFTPGGSVTTTGVSTAKGKAIIGTAGYIATGNKETDASTVNITPTVSNGTTRYISKATSSTSSGTATATNGTASTSVTGMVTSTTDTGYSVSASATGGNASVTASSVTVGVGYNPSSVTATTTAKSATGTSASQTKYIQKGVLSASVSSNSGGSASMGATGFTPLASGTSSYYVTLTTSAGSVKAKASVGTEGYVKTETNETAATSVAVSGNGTKLYIPAGGYAGSVSSHSITTTPVVTGALSGTGTNIGTTTKPSGTDGTDYWAFTPGGSVTTTGVSTAKGKATISTAGYIPTGNNESSASTVNITPTASNGTTRYITKATSSTSNGTASATANAGTASIAKQPSASATATANGMDGGYYTDTTTSSYYVDCSASAASGYSTATGGSASASVTASSVTVGAGYNPSSVTASTTASSTGNKTGNTATSTEVTKSASKKIYLKPATIAGSSTNATATTTVAPGNVTIANNETAVSGKTRIAASPSTATTGISTYYIALKANAAANTTGTTSSISGSGTATVTGAGYAPTSLTGSVSVSGTATAKTSSKDSSVYYIPVASGAYSASVSSHSVTTTPVVTTALSGQITTIGTTTKPSGTDGTDYWSVTPGGSVTTTGVSTAKGKATVGTTGYIAAGNTESSASTVNITPTVSAGTTRYLTKATSSTSSGTATATNGTASASVTGMVTTTTNTGYSVSASATGGNASVTASSVTVGAGYNPSSVTASTTAKSATGTSASETKYIQKGVLSASVSSNSGGSASMAATGFTAASSATSYYVTLSTSAGSVKAKASVGTEGYVKTETNETSATSVAVSGNGTKLYVPAGAYSGSVSSHSITTTPVVTGSISGTVTNIGTTTKPSSGTDGTNYWTITPSGSVTTTGVSTAKGKATVGTAGYIPTGNNESSASTVNITPTVSAGTARYILKGAVTNNTSGGTSSGTVNWGSQIKIGSGYYPSDLYYTAQAAPSGNIQLTQATSTDVKAYATATVRGVTAAISGGGLSGTATASGSSCSISDSTNTSGISVTTACTASRAAVSCTASTAGWASGTIKTLDAGSTAMTAKTYYINSVTLPKGKSFSITVYTGASTTNTFTFTTDASGNTTVTGS